MRTVAEIAKEIEDKKIPYPLSSALESELQTAMTIEHQKDNGEWRAQARAEWAMIQEWPGVKREVSAVSEQIAELGKLLNNHLVQDALDKEKRDILYSARWEAQEKRQDERFSSLHDALAQMVSNAVVPAIERAIDPIKKYLFGNGDDKGCMARRVDTMEKYIETQQKSKQLNWISTAQVITWLFVAVSIAINLLHK